MSEKSILKGHMLCDSIYITFLKWHNNRDDNRLVDARIEGCQGRGEARGEGRGGCGCKR